MHGNIAEEVARRAVLAQCYACEGGWSLDLKLVRSNLSPRTIMRGPGFLNAVMIIEHIIEHVASHLGLDPVEVKQRNFIRSTASIPPSQVCALPGPAFSNGVELGQHFPSWALYLPCTSECLCVLQPPSIPSSPQLL